MDYVFHAAALKQVPSCEFFPLQAVATNVQGSDNVIRAAAANGVKSVVCLSTDKAVYPINAMGMSKALMEKVAQAFARNNPDQRHRRLDRAVRQRHVLARLGDPAVRRADLREGKPLTVTDPTMTRFLMSLAESVDLVTYAFTNAQPGDLFVRKAPAATIGDLATAVALLLGAEPEITMIGTRHGEKLYEVLLSRRRWSRCRGLRATTSGCRWTPVRWTTASSSSGASRGRASGRLHQPQHDPARRRADDGSVAHSPEIQRCWTARIVSDLTSTVRGSR